VAVLAGRVARTADLGGGLCDQAGDDHPPAGDDRHLDAELSRADLALCALVARSPDLLNGCSSVERRPSRDR